MLRNYVICSSCEDNRGKKRRWERNQSKQFGTKPSNMIIGCVSNSVSVNIGLLICYKSGLFQTFNGRTNYRSVFRSNVCLRVGLFRIFLFADRWKFVLDWQFFESFHIASAAQYNSSDGVIQNFWSFEWQRATVRKHFLKIHDLQFFTPFHTQASFTNLFPINKEFKWTGPRSTHKPLHRQIH